MVDLIRRIDDFLFDGLLPLWHGRGWDARHGGMFERLDADANPLELGHRRLVVQCRQLYMASHAAILRPTAGHAPVARAVFDALTERYRDPEHGGWFFSVTPEGRPHDATKDAYGHAFVLLGLAWYHRVGGCLRAAGLLAETADLLATRFAHPLGGLWEAAAADWTPRSAMRRQNPHMHALEAHLAALEATGDGRHAEAAHRLLDLAAARFIDADRGILREFFTDDWSPDPDRGHEVEPGHHYEWVWILHEARRLLGRSDVATLAESLFAWAEAHGRAADGHVHDAVDREGRVLRGTRRIWPAAERVKAMAARGDIVGTRAAVIHLMSAFRLEGGRWIEHLGTDGRPMVTDLPGTTGYHLFLALAEARRVLLPATPHPVDGLMAAIRARPAMYLGEPTLTGMGQLFDTVSPSALLLPSGALERLSRFAEWVMARHGGRSSRGWVRAIRVARPDLDETAGLAYLFALWDEFVREHPDPGRT